MFFIYIKIYFFKKVQKSDSNVYLNNLSINKYYFIFNDVQFIYLKRNIKYIQYFLKINYIKILLKNIIKNFYFIRNYKLIINDFKHFSNSGCLYNKLNLKEIKKINLKTLKLLQFIEFFKTNLSSIKNTTISNYNFNVFALFLNKGFFYKESFYKNSEFKDNLVFLNTFFCIFFEFFLKKNSFIVFLPVINKVESNEIKFLVIKKRLKKIYSKDINQNSYRMLFNIIFFLFTSYDVLAFIRGLKILFESTHYTNHKKLLSIFKLFFSNYFSMYSFKYGVLGLTFLITGKISLGGSSKKKRVKIVLGKSSRGSKDVKASFKSDYIKTFSGTLGVSCLLAFK